MDFNAPPLDVDAAQRSFNHLYLEEHIARNVRMARLDEDGTTGNSTYSHDRALVEVMRFLCPTYAASVRQALKTGLDEDAVEIFVYELENKDDQENAPPNVFRQLPPPDHGLAAFEYTVKDNKGSDLFVFDTGASIMDLLMTDDAFE